MSSNDFDPVDSRRIWSDHPYSIWSGRNGSDIGDSLSRHHILRRRKGDTTLSSMYNCALILNHSENIARDGELSTEPVRKLLLNKVKRHIDQIIDNGGYTRTETDEAFLEKYKTYFND